MKEYIEDELKEIELEDLEILRSTEKAYLDSGEVLLEACLKLPFKNKEKVDSLIGKISIYRNNIVRIDRAIYDVKNPTPAIGGICSIINGSNLTWSSSTWSSSNWTLTPSQMQSTTFVNVINVKYMMDSTDIKDYMVIDDLFKSELGNYYLLMPDGTPLDLNRIIEIDIESKVGKWYDSMCQNFVRESKLKRISKDGMDS